MSQITNYNECHELWPLIRQRLPAEQFPEINFRLTYYEASSPGGELFIYSLVLPGGYYGSTLYSGDRDATLEELEASIKNAARSIKCQVANQRLLESGWTPPPRARDMEPQMSLVDVFEELQWCWDNYPATPRNEYLQHPFEGYTRREYFGVLLGLARAAFDPVSTSRDSMEQLHTKLTNYRSSSCGIALDSDRKRPQSRSNRAYVAFRELHRHVRRALFHVRTPDPLAPTLSKTNEATGLEPTLGSLHEN